ncbi:short-chain dehydrogenase protein [Rutstroemia sp. NJR-2017a WRK4]|nr:short-chain dehydrogenase protein [Rutstroemia sp. NJR-2017a WRK4]
MASRKIVLVTGGNNGIGYEIVKALLQSSKPYHILMGSRSLEKAQAATANLQKECPETANTFETLQVDLNSDESIEKAYEQVKNKHGYIDTLINNAGATFDIAFLNNQVSLRTCFNHAYDTNVTGTHVLTWTFTPLLLRSPSPQLIFIAGLSAINQAGEKYFPTPALPSGWPKTLSFETIGYRCSKTALNMLMLDWNHKLQADGVKVWSVSPGMLVTDLGGLRHKAKEMGAGDASEGGVLVRGVVEGERDAEVGRLIGREGVLSW